MLLFYWVYLNDLLEINFRFYESFLEIFSRTLLHGVGVHAYLPIHGFKSRLFLHAVFQPPLFVKSYLGITLYRIQEIYVFILLSVYFNLNAIFTLIQYFKYNMN